MFNQGAYYSNYLTPATEELLEAARRDMTRSKEQKIKDDSNFSNQKWASEATSLKIWKERKNSVNQELYNDRNNQ